MSSGAIAGPTVKRVLDRLAETYGMPMRTRPMAPLDSLIATILSQATSDTNSQRAFTSFKRAYPTWSKAARADPKQIADAIRIGGLADRKAKTILETLEAIRKMWGRWTLAPLVRMDSQQAMELLLSIKGVGKKTAACVLLFSLEREVFPVDTHIFRVAGRVGWLEPWDTPDRAHDRLASMIPPHRYYDAHINLIAHGRNDCNAKNPRCRSCPVNTDCVFYAKKNARAGQPAGA